PSMGPEASQPSSVFSNESALADGVRLSTSTEWLRSCSLSDCATPLLSYAMMTRLPPPSVTPVDLQRASGGRSTGSGTRRGILLAASKLNSSGAGRVSRGAATGGAVVFANVVGVVAVVGAPSFSPSVGERVGPFPAGCPILSPVV